ncbi:MAG: winged helix DNA-binding domain-containing protein [Sandaracinaceae bacterium]
MKERTIPDAERRARLVARHHLAKDAKSPETAVRAVVAMHSSDPATPFLGCWARVPKFSVEALERALTEDKTLWRIHAMRRTLFVVDAGEGGLVEAAATREIADKERKRLLGYLEGAVKAKSLGSWLEKVEEKVIAELGQHAELRTSELAKRVRELGTRITIGSGKWQAESSLASRLLMVMAMDARIVRTRSAGTWRASQYGWAETERWFGAAPSPAEVAPAQAELVRRYVATHGPVTLTDVRWWTGWTARASKAALQAIGAVTVRLEDGSSAFVVEGDEAPVKAKKGAVTLLPGLDPTPMGFKERAFYLGSHHQARLFDTNGNIGPTVWVDGRIVGGWAQKKDGEVVVALLEDVPKAARAKIDKEAAALTKWMDGVVTIPRFRTPLERELSR